jgi:hypothetical protein
LAEKKVTGEDRKVQVKHTERKTRQAAVSLRRAFLGVLRDPLLIVVLEGGGIPLEGPPLGLWVDMGLRSTY